MLHEVDEDGVDFLLYCFQPRNIVGILRQKRIEHRLVLACGVKPPLDADLLDQFLKAERAADYADRSEDRRWIAVYLVAGAGDHIAAGSRDILDENQHRQLFFARKLPDAQVDLARLHGRTTRRIDQERYGLRVFYRKGAFEYARDACKRHSRP